MLLAPFSLTDSSTPQRRSAARMPMQVPAWLLAWVALGTLAVVLSPATRGGDVGGYSLPFWLLGAPLLDVLLLARRRWLRACARRAGTVESPSGQDSLLSIVQMHKGIPVATFAIGEAGAANAALFAVAMLATGDPELAQRLTHFRRAQADKVMAMKLPEV